ncbi:MAG: magnesium/cobalt transporter CorA [Pseudomonadota bacterium]|jgi:magnesium transporter
MKYNLRIKSDRKIFRRQTLPGAMPGTIQTDPEAPPPAIHVMAWSGEDLVEERITESGQVKSLIEDWPMTWVNVDGLGDADTLTELASIFNIHKLALEDVVNVHQRAKVEDYDNHLFIVARMLNFQGDSLDTEQISLFVGEGFLVTFQERVGDCLDPVRERIRKKSGRIRTAGADYLAYAMLDAVVDAWFPVLERFGERLEDLESVILEKPGSETVSRIHKIKRELLEVRRTIWPMRETVNSLFREDMIVPETQLYLRDCYDHVIQVLDIVESYRDMASGLMEFYLSSVSNRMNEIMKVLTIIATIFIPLTFIAGIYGMNFDTEVSPWNMPELQWKFGYPAFWVVTVIIGIAMVLFFKKLGWLGTRENKGKVPR